MPAPVGYTSANERVLQGSDRLYFDNCFAPLSTVVSVSSKGLLNRDYDAFQQAWQRVLETTPLLQTQVEGSDTFRDVSSDKWPCLAVADPVEDDGILMKEAASIKRKHVTRLRTEGQDAHRISVSTLTLLRSPTRIAFIVVAPHHFADGVGLGVLLNKFLIYSLCPRILWSFIDLFSTKEVPTFWEMILKKDYTENICKVPKIDASSSAKMSKDNFRFETYDMSDPSMLRCSLDTMVASVDALVLRKCLRELRSNSEGSLSLTSAFGGLAIKTLALLIRQGGFITEDTKEKYLLASNGFDGRSLSKWGDMRDLRRNFPVLANYAFAACCQVKIQEALDQDVSDIALCIKQCFQRIREDLDYRIQTVKASYLFLAPSSGIYVGCSSINIPNAVRLTNLEIDSRIDFGPVPHVWFYVVTIGSRTQIDVDIQLPISGMDGAKVEEFIQQAAAGSPLEPFFNTNN